MKTKEISTRTLAIISFVIIGGFFIAIAWFIIESEQLPKNATIVQWEEAYTLLDEEQLYDDYPKFEYIAVVDNFNVLIKVKGKKAKSHRMTDHSVEDNGMITVSIKGGKIFVFSFKNAMVVYADKNKGKISIVYPINVEKMLDKMDDDESF